MFAGSVVQAGSPIVGDWTGTGTAVTVGPGDNGAEELATLDILSATSSGGNLTLLGTLDVTCVGHLPANCGTGSVINISGSLSPSGVLDFGTAGNPDLFAGSYSGGTNFSGVASSLDGDVYDWKFASSSTAAAPEIDPAGMLSGITLMAGGLAIIRGRRRKADELCADQDMHHGSTGKIA